LKNEFYTSVILPVPLPRLFTYSVPDELVAEMVPGKRVVVQFGKKRYLSAIIHSLHTTAPEGFDVKEIVTVLDDIPVVNDIQLAFWQWLADYYMCTLGEVMKAALPSALKLESETNVYLNSGFESETPLSESEEQVLSVLIPNKATSLDEIAKSYKKKDLLKVIKHLVELGALVVEESLRNKKHVKTEVYVELLPHLLYESEIRPVMDALTKAPKQLHLLMHYLQLSGIFAGKPVEVSRKTLLAGVSVANEAFKTLVKKNIFRTYEKVQSETIETSEHRLKPLSEAQFTALQQIRSCFEDKSVTLLHGYTASGKTELYIHLIDEQLNAGRQVLYLLPEIALTAQIINRLKGAFGDKVGIYHSKFTDAERVRVWQGLIDSNSRQRYQIVLGVRSSVFLPFDNLGLIIVDEEHENTYKQFDPAPRYNARDAAIVLASMHKAKVLLGTATPSVESYFNAQNGKYGLVELFQRYADVKLPEIVLANTEDARLRKQMRSHFHPLLIENIKAALDAGEQVILFQNRRGYSPFMQCTTCQTIPKCKHCDVSLTYHKHLRLLVCHYCGYTSGKITECDACGSPTLSMHSFGTEKVEDELSFFFPGRRMARMDTDTTRTRKAYEEIIASFENREVDILIGTQMVSKGLDFDNVSLVGILDADHLLNFPDFRAYERSFQLMSQVSGRAGRKNKQGLVVIQTSNVTSYILDDVISNNYTHMYQTQLAERQQFHYPPFTRLIRLSLKHKIPSVLDMAAEMLAKDLHASFGNRVYGPEYPLIARINNWYYKNILLKIERSSSLVKAKELIGLSITKLNQHPEYKTVIVQPDIDPM
jgi:primosomal protein N' (replication factor Y)